MTAAINEERLNALLGKAVVDIGAVYGAALVVIGEALGLYRSLAAGGPATSAELASGTGTAERYVRDWLNAQAAAGYLDFDPATGRYALSPEAALIFADEASPACLLGPFQAAVSALAAEAKLTAAFRSGDGIGWHEHGPGLSAGLDRFWRNQFAANLASTWLPALDGVEAKLLAGARVADVGCGRGSSTVLMATAYPASSFIGFDLHSASITAAREQAALAGVADRARFEVADALAYPGAGYDLVTTFDCLHDLGNPVGAAAHIRQTLDPDGTWLIVEPKAGDQVEENLHPLGRLNYASSAFICTACALAQPGGMALGNQAGEARLREVIAAGGFGRVRRAVEAPFNLILEARP